MLDSEDNLVKSLGYLNPWKCAAVLITSEGSKYIPIQ